MRSGIAGKLAASVMLAAALAACEAAPARSYVAQLPIAFDGGRPLDVVVVDHAAVVTGIAGAGPGDARSGVSRGGEPNQVVVGWLGGMCDLRTTLTVSLDGSDLTIGETTETAGGGCLLAGISRSVVHDLKAPVSGEAIRFVSGTGS